MKQYEKYKPSGIEWLGDIPEHWEVCRIKNTLKAIYGGGTPSTEILDYWNGNIPWVSAKDMKSDRITKSEDYVTEIAIKNSASRLIKPNKVLFVARSGILKHTLPVAINIVPVAINQDLKALDPKSKINTEYLFYSLKGLSLSILMECNKVGATVDSVEIQEFLKFNITIPSLFEQTAIANYLNTKTAAIDRKIELLTAKADKYKALRRSLINETVCRGLPASEGFTQSETLTKMKDSGIEWIGMIPEHWEVKRVKDVFKYTTGNTPESKNESYYEGDNTWVCIGDISEDKYISDSKMKISDKAISDLNMIKTPKGSLLYSFKLSIGKMAFVNQDVYTNEAILSIFPNKRISLNFIYYMLPYFLEFAATENIYGAKMLNQKIIANALLVMPELDEQIQIASYLETKTTQIDTILTNISEQIVKLTQLRKTLINDVVTGKIKVTE